MLEQLESLEIGNYRILKELGKDSFGPYYEAVETSDAEKRVFSLQVITPEVVSQENFLVRFELLKSLLPLILHENLCRVIELIHEKDLFVIIRESTRGWQRFTEISSLLDVKQSVSLFHGLARGLNALQQVRNSYYKSGIELEHFHEDLIWIRMEGPELHVKLDALLGPFLFYGDKASATLSYLFQKNSDLLYEGQHYLSSSTRACTKASQSPSVYSFGAFAYQYFCNVLPKGHFPKVAEVHPDLDSFWSSWIEPCLEGKIRTMDELCERFEFHISTSKTPSNTETKVRKQEPPSGMTLVYVEDKVYLGAPDGPLHEQPFFRARIQPFFMDITPITCAEFERFMPTYHRSSYSKGDDHPATLITWNMAKAYCRWRSDSEGLAPETYRLPTEYEWEAAVRGTSQEQYPWSEALNSKYIHCGLSSAEGSRSVKSTPPGRFGIYDLLGNVWEWTESWYKPHPFSKHQDKTYLHHFRTVKGACWLTPLHECRASTRKGFPPQERRGDIGFRCVRPVETP